MSYRVEFSGQTLEQLKCMDRHTVRILLRWIENNLEGCKNPRRYGKGFPGARGVVWRYPIGPCRFMAEIQDKRQVVVLIWLGKGYETDWITAF